MSGIERIAEHATLRHEHVGGEQRAQDERNAARDVHERRQEPDRAGQDFAGWNVRRRIERVAGRGQRRRQHDGRADMGRADDAKPGDPRPVDVLEVRLDAHRYRQAETGQEVQRRRDSGVRIVVLRLRQHREDAGQGKAESVRVAETRSRQEVCRSEAQPAGGQDSAGQIPRPIEALVPAARARQCFAARRDREHRHPDCPDELVRAAAFAPLVQQGHGEHERQQGSDGRQDDRERHRPESEEARTFADGRLPLARGAAITGLRPDSASWAATNTSSRRSSSTDADS